MAIALGAVIPSLIAYTLAFILALAKILRRNTIIHNVSEILIYTGIAFLIVPLFDVLWASILLITIAVYDIIAVFKSKHMISLAKFQTESNVFAGLQIPYANKPTKLRTHAPKNVKKTTKKMRSAILGGGDIVFPLLFSGAILQWLVTSGYTPLQAYLFTLIPTAAAAIGLVVLFKVAQKDKFYPAMPPLAAGCFVGLLIVSLLV